MTDRPRDVAVARVLLIVLGLNLLVAATKLVVGWTIGAVALVADGVHSMFDGASNVIGLAGIFTASRPPDARHPYGHRRFESMAAIGIGVLILGGFIAIGRAVIARFVEPGAAPAVTWSSALAVMGTIVVNVFITRYERRRGTELHSMILLADAKHTLSDTISALVVLASFGGAALGFAWADLVAAMLVCAFIGRTGWVVVKDALDVLTDVVQIAPEDLLACVLQVPNVAGAHKIRSRGVPSHVHVDLHIQLPPELSLAAAHAITHQVADCIKTRFPNVEDVVIHTEPAGAEFSPPTHQLGSENESHDRRA